MGKKLLKYVADFETTTQEEDCRVWAAGIYSMENEEFYLGNDIEFFLNFANTMGNAVFYFHNLKFDGSFIIDWLFRHNFKHTTNRRKLNPGEFNTLISDMNQFYSIEISFREGQRTTIYDSLKIIPFKVAVIAKSFGLEVEKGEIDYSYPRPIGWEITKEEQSYIYRDCKIVSDALKVLFSQNLTRITQGSNALYDFKRTLPRKFEKIFPPPKYDKDIRQAYKGGFTYCNPLYQGKNIKEGIVLDKNSMYPSVMRFEKLPFGEGIFYEGKYIQDDLYPLYIQMFVANFELKKNHLPTLQIKGGRFGFLPTEYVTSSNGDEISLCLTSVDLELFLEHYDVLSIEYISGWKFSAKVGLFDEYIDKWYKVKEESTRTGNKGMRTLAKLMLNALYGKFATTPECQSKIPYFDEELNLVKYKLGEIEERKPLYLPVAAFITAYARADVIRNAQKNYHRFIYADTDSLHLIGEEMPQGIDIDDYRLGAWKVESHFKRARFLRAKSYIEYIKEPLPHFTTNPKPKVKYHVSHETFKERLYYAPMKVTCAGMPSSCHKYVTWENFVPGSEFQGKLLASVVAGGTVLKETTFTIKG